MRLELKESYRVAVEELLNGATKTEACRRAGFRQPKQQAARIFRRPDVQLYMEQRREKLAKAHDTTKEDIAAWCWQILEINPLDVLVRDEKGNERIDLGAVKQSALNLFKSGALNYTESRSGRKVTSVTQIKDLAGLKKFAINTLCQMYGFYDNTVKVEGELGVVNALLEGRKRAGRDGTEDS